MNTPITPLILGMTDSFFAFKKRLIRLGQTTKHPNRVVAVVFATMLCASQAAPLRLTLVAKAQGKKLQQSTGSKGKANTATGRHWNGKVIPRNDTPEIEVGLPATLEEAHGNATITGKVVYANGKPASGIKLDVYCRWLGQTELWGYRRNQANHYRWPNKITNLLSGTAVTGADGTYRFTGLLPQHYGIHLHPTINGNRAPVGLLPPSAIDLDAVAKQTRSATNIVLRRSAQVRIRVLDQDSNQPLEGVMSHGFITDNSPRPRVRVADAHGGRRPAKGFPYQAITDQNGNCSLSLDEGRAYFCINGGIYIGTPAGEPEPKGFPTRFITTQGVYKRDGWTEVTALSPVPVTARSPRRARNGETEFQLTKNAPASFVIRIKRDQALTPAYKSLLRTTKQLHKQLRNGTLKIHHSK